VKFSFIFCNLKFTEYLKWFTILLVSFIPLSLFGQFTVNFEQADENVVDVKYISVPDSSDEISNYLIKEIAKGIPQRFDYTSYKYGYRRVLRVINTGKGKYEASVDMNEAKCMGDVIYKDFDISDVLFPNRMDIKVTLLNKYKQTVKSIELQKAPIHWGYNKVIYFEFSDTIRVPQFYFNVESQRVYYSDSAKWAFDQKVELIDEYYNAKAFISQGMKKLDNFNFTNVDMILVYDIMLKEIEKQVEELFNNDFPGKLRLSGHDPINFIDLFTVFSEKTREIRARENDCLAHLDKIYYERGMLFLLQNDVGKATMYFKRSFNYNNYYVPSHYQFAKILFLHDSVQQSAVIISNVLNTMNPDPQMQDSVLQFAGLIDSTLIRQGYDYLKLEKFNEALEVFQNAIIFCSNSPGIVCTNRVYQGLASSKFGIYQSFLTVSEKAIKTGKYELAEVYIAAAREYQKENSSEIIGDAAADVVTTKLARAIIVRADTLNSAGKYDQALLLYDKAASLCAQKSEIDCGDDLERGYRKAYNGVYSSKLSTAYKSVTSGLLDHAEEQVNDARTYQQEHYKYITYTLPADTIDNRIQNLRYIKDITEALVLLKYQNCRPALALLDAARILSENYKFKRNSKLDSLLQVAAKPVLTEDLVIAEKLIASEKYDSAGILCDRIRQNLVDYKLQNDSVLPFTLDETVKLLHQNICRKAASNIAELKQSAFQFAQDTDYIAAQEKISSALIIAGINNNCGIDTVSILKLLQEYTLVADYQRMIINALSSLQSGDTIAFFKGYTEAGQYYYAHHPLAFNIRFSELTEICETHKDFGFLKQAISFMLTQEDPYNAIKVLKQIFEIGYPAEITSQLQIELGEALAQRDHATNSETDPASNISMHTGGDKWYTAFRKAYMKTWKGF
jgi:hypothetical protein